MTDIINNNNKVNINFTNIHLIKYEIYIKTLLTNNI